VISLSIVSSRPRQKLPKVNKELALKLMEQGDEEAEMASRKKKGKVGITHGSTNLFSRPEVAASERRTPTLITLPPLSPNLPHEQVLPSVLGDDRFKVMFENPDYQVDEQSEEFRLLNPIVSRVGQKRQKKLRLMAQQVAASQKVTCTRVAELRLQAEPRLQAEHGNQRTPLSCAPLACRADLMIAVQVISFTAKCRRLNESETEDVACQPRSNHRRDVIYFIALRLFGSREIQCASHKHRRVGAFHTQDLIDNKILKIMK